MFRSWQSCSGAAGRGRAAVLWSLGVFLVAQLGLDVALNVSRPLRDPEYGRRLNSLRARIAERAPGRPLVLFLGSSRIACVVRPAVLPANQRSPGAAGPVVFNYGICGAGPVIELLTLRRLLADGVHPDCVIVEFWTAASADSGDRQVTPRYPHERLMWGDLDVLRPFRSAPESETRHWYEDHIVPWLSLRTRLLNQWAPSWVVPTKRFNVEFDNLDDWGWLACPLYTEDQRPPGLFDRMRKDVIAAGNGFYPSDASRLAFIELLALCRQEKIPAVLLATPDAFVDGYAPDARQRMDDFMRSVSAENDAPLIDARGWAPDSDFFEGTHLTHRGSAVFTEKLGRDVLQPYLDGEPLARRWPPGRLNASPASPSP